MNMNNFDVATAFVFFANKREGKPRPVLVISDTDDSISFYSITSKFAEKSERIQKQYYPIQEWAAAGLFLPSWVDIRSRAEVNKNVLKFKKIGSLSLQDVIGLTNFINDFYK